MSNFNFWLESKWLKRLVGYNHGLFDARPRDLKVAQEVPEILSKISEIIVLQRSAHETLRLGEAVEHGWHSQAMH